MLTDRDIVVRAVVEGKGVDTTAVAEAMTANVPYCFDDQAVEEVAATMGRSVVRRLPVADRNKRLVGIVGHGDIAVEGSASASGNAPEQVGRPTR
jgi:CBS domain-containing protein